MAREAAARLCDNIVMVRQILPNRLCTAAVSAAARRSSHRLTTACSRSPKAPPIRRCFHFSPCWRPPPPSVVQMRAEYVQPEHALILFRRCCRPAPRSGAPAVPFSRTTAQSLLIVASCCLLWAASSVIKSLIDGFNAAYRVPRNRSILAHAWIGMMLALLSLLPLLGATSLILFGGAMEAAVLKSIKGRSRC